MEIIKGIKIIDLGLLIRNNLIFSDFHIGYEESLNKQGVLVPRMQFESIIKRLDNIFSKIEFKLDKIIINGDLKHEFGSISETEWRHTLKLLDFFSSKCNEIILVKGNHDKKIAAIVKKRKVKVVDYFQIKDVLIIHGNKLLKDFKEVKTIIIGHEHPAVTLKDGSRIEKFKCFLSGKYKNKNLIVMPSFNLVTEGTDVIREKPLSPFLKQELSDFKVFIVADKIYGFGKLKELK